MHSGVKTCLVRIGGTIALACGLLLPLHDRAQAQDPARLPMVRILPNSEAANAVLIYPRPTGGARENWNEFGGKRIVRNVMSPTITPFLPKAEEATGAAVVIAPGGAFMMLSIDSEGYDVARWLAARGVAAFVLKYRLRPTPADPAEFQNFMMKAWSQAPRGGLDLHQPAAEDAVQAVRLVRGRATEWGVDPKRIGLLGFSAGAAAAVSASLTPDSDARPDFLASIYGPMTGVSVPTDAPPLFLAMAADDPLFGDSPYELAKSWKSAGRSYEFHLYEQGGHGFGMETKGKTSDLWPEQFLKWMRTRGLLIRASTATPAAFASPATPRPAPQTIAELACHPRVGPLFTPEQLLNPRAKPLAFPTSFDPAIVAALQSAAVLDPAGLCVYRDANRALPPPSVRRVVFIGDSITEGWNEAAPDLFRGDVLNRGIAGQTSSQMVLRFREDVINLRPRVVHIMAGTNDLNTPTGAAITQSNITTMVELAKTHGITVILGSIPPASYFWTSPGLKPAQEIVALNARIKAFAAENRIAYVDYHRALSGPDFGLQDPLTNDGLHPNQPGYDRMTPLVETAIKNVLR